MLFPHFIVLSAHTYSFAAIKLIGSTLVVGFFNDFPLFVLHDLNMLAFFSGHPPATMHLFTHRIASHPNSFHLVHDYSRTTNNREQQIAFCTKTDTIEMRAVSYMYILLPKKQSKCNFSDEKRTAERNRGSEC